MQIKKLNELGTYIKAALYDLSKSKNESLCSALGYVLYCLDQAKEEEVLLDKDEQIKELMETIERNAKTWGQDRNDFIKAMDKKEKEKMELSDIIERLKLELNKEY